MIGPIMLDVRGTSLAADELELLQHPLVGGVILFSRNYQSPEQISALIRQIRTSANKSLLIAVDHEGGRVQRFLSEFSRIPAMADLYRAAKGDLALACQSAFHAGSLMAQEVLAVGIDISFAPVLDLLGISEVIGDRAFHADAELVTPLAKAFIQGMNTAGMQATGKHFPGHGSVKEDSHIALPIDNRTMTQIAQADLIPFKALMAEHALAAVMPAHIIFPEIDKDAVGFSPYWLQTVLRQQLAFDGVIFSDDLTMEGATYIGGFVERAEAAQAAGCDMLLVCNNQAAAIDIIDNANIQCIAESSVRLQTLQANSNLTWAELTDNSDWQQAKSWLSQHQLL